MALRRAEPPVGPRPTRDPEVHSVLAMARRELGADAALLSEVRGGREHVRWAVGGYEGVVAPLRDTICERLLDGRISSVVADTAAHPAVRDLPAVRDGEIRAYIGVPFETADARAYVLCCLAHETRPDLGDSDVRFLQGLVESLRPLLA
ncbi:MAG TPA: GAF domain-containing protein [Solirubrobacter sp.]|jgi:GAF domain-containing protein|nr:GAF domain-containing protein [Solirubrobacter sp.]